MAARKSGRLGARRCTICAHAERGRIDYLLVVATGAHGTGRRPLAEKYGVSGDALFRHAKRHISDEYRRAVKVGPFESEEALRKLLAETGASVLDRFNAVYRGHLSRWLVALEAGNDDMMLRHGGLLVTLLTKVGLLTREMLPPGAHQITQNFYLSSDYYEFQRRAVAVLRRHPEALTDWVAAFRAVPAMIEAAPDAA
jgi:hypothetical protein